MAPHSFTYFTVTEQREKYKKGYDLWPRIAPPNTTV